MSKTTPIRTSGLSRSRNSRILARLEESARLDQRRYAAAALHLAAELREQLLQALVAAVDVLQADDFRFARRGQACHDEPRAGADVGRLHGCAGKLLGTFDDGRVAFHRHL